MNKRVQSILLLLIVAVLLLPASLVHSAAAPQQQVLLLFDSLAIGTAREGNVNELQRQLASLNAKVTLVSLDQYERGAMAPYSNVITVINAPDLAIANKSYLGDLERYKGQYLHIGYSPPASLKKALQLTTGVMYGASADLQIGEFQETGLQVQDMPYIAASKAVQAYGTVSFRDRSLQVPYAVSSGKYTYVPYLVQGNASILAIANVLKDWLHPNVSPQTYLVLKEIYPFSDLELLEKTADELYQDGIPFIASVRPVFSNTDFPAMQRYLEALKIVQSRNGSILVNAPVIMPSINSSDHTLQEKMNGFINLLINNRIAPLGIGADSYWSYDKEYANAGMGFFDSAVLFQDDKQVLYMEQTNTSKTFASSLYSLPLDFLQSVQHKASKAMPAFPLNTAITVDFPQDEAELENMLHSLEQYWIPFADYKQGAHRVVTDTSTISSLQGVISINGQELNIDYTPETVNDDFQYTQEQKKSFTKLFNVQNQFFIVVIIISLLLFGGLLIIGNRMYRKKYMK
ncbi:hypothetical protein [Paenibacillus monticola]|uniref:DUF2334 domain-containing protein n=1 Tax=Paenibacillus monticola TaxID=2666075 RepID=A0A7X2H5Z1_9BACL|nr:hypothetical protein [Paenibacillus monticola]MRN54073.1 hypothetical protein [Paenibacillus monticola]